MKHLSDKTIAFKEYALSLREDYDDGFDFSKESLSSFVSFLKSRELSESSIKAILREVLSYGRWLQERGYSVRFSDDFQQGKPENYPCR